jgi:hypothetical protein
MGGAAAQNQPLMQTGAATRTQTVSGQLVQASNDEIRVGPSTGNEIRLRITPNTQVTQNGQTTSVANLPPGTQVRASYNIQQGEAVATSVEVSPSGGQGTMGPSGSSGSVGGSTGSPGTMGGGSTGRSGGTGTMGGSTGSSGSTGTMGGSTGSSGSTGSGSSGSSGY